jgi:hypothetical protein
VKSSKHLLQLLQIRPTKCTHYNYKGFICNNDITMHGARNLKSTTFLEESIATIFGTEDGGSMFIQNYSKLLQD